MLRSLIGEIRMIPQDGKLAIELSGELAGMLWLSEAGQQKSPAGSTDGAGQMTLVAGARNHRYRHLLKVVV